MRKMIAVFALAVALAPAASARDYPYYETWTINGVPTVVTITGGAGPGVPSAPIRVPAVIPVPMPGPAATVTYPSVIRQVSGCPNGRCPHAK